MCCGVAEEVDMFSDGRYCPTPVSPRLGEKGWMTREGEPRLRSASSSRAEGDLDLGYYDRRERAYQRATLLEQCR
jgi:hypothetical protein